MFRPEIKVIDCTVRDGGLMNKWQFDDAFVSKVYTALTEAGVDYMEIGYLSSECAYSRDEVGPWKFCAEADIKRILGDSVKKIKLSAMADIGRIEYDDIPQKSESSLDMIRVACYAHQVDAAISLAHHCIDKGYETTINLMAVSTVKEQEVDQVLEVLAETPMGQFMLEADSPYLVPEPYRGTVKRCEPAFVREIAAVAAKVKGCSLDELSEATCRAAAGFFAKLGTT
jgi:4-hydroxy 2-oxovalerate aldolase